MTNRLLARFAGALALMALPALAAPIQTSLDLESVPKSKRTELGLYVTAEEAHRAIAADPSIVFIDVRDPHEVMFVGHPTPADANIPVKIATDRFDEKKGVYQMQDNPDFVAAVDRLLAAQGLDRSAPIVVMCRSGGRSAAAVKRLAEAGFANVWNMIDGFEGDKSKAGARDVNGWRNAGLPWAYEIEPEKAWRPATE